MKQKLQSFCLPVGGSSNSGCGPVAKLMVCLPCPPPIIVAPDYADKKMSSFPFAVPQRIEGESQHKSGGGKYLPPPEKRICSKSCIHKSDLKGDKACTWNQGIPCVAHCYMT